MKQLPDGGRWSLDALVHKVFGRNLPLERETTWFILVSALDVFVTYLALRFSADHKTQSVLVEANPIAKYFFDGRNVQGLVYFKFAMVAVVAVIAQVIATKRKRVARWLLIGATALVGTVVVYSLRLLLENL